MKRTRILLLVILAVLLPGCGRLEKAESNTIEIGKDGSISEVSVETFKKGKLSESELEDFVNDSISGYNSQAGKDAAELKKLKVKGETARVIMEYKSWEDYKDFHQVPLFIGSVAQAAASGYAFDGEFRDRKGQAAVSGMISALGEEYQVAVISEAIAVIVPGEIQYVSDNVKVLEEDMVSIEKSDSANQALVTLEHPAYIIYN